MCKENSADPDHMLRFVDSDQVLHCLLSECILLKFEFYYGMNLNSKVICPIDKGGKFH